MERQRILVTGIGVLSPIGLTTVDFWKALVNGTSGVRAITAFDASNQKCRIAAELKNFNPGDHFSGKRIRRMARFSQLASCAAIQAVGDSGLDLEHEDPARVGCVIGTAAGDYDGLELQHRTFFQKGPGAGSPISVPRIITNMSAANAGIDLELTGPNIGIATACASGSHALAVALMLLETGRADIVIAGGSESTITPLVVDAYACMGVLSVRNDEPEKASRPFDADRDGFVIGEGAACLVLEREDSARKRGARPYAVFRGVGMTADAYSIAVPEPDGTQAARAIRLALDDARLDPDDIGYINAHGTSTKMNDKTETLAIRTVFDGRTGGIPVSSCKSMIGHTLGAAGALEAAATVLSLYHGVLPPTINHEKPDPECALDVVPNTAREVEVKAALSNSFGFGGQNCVLAFSRVG